MKSNLRKKNPISEWGHKKFWGGGGGGGLKFGLIFFHWIKCNIKECLKQYDAHHALTSIHTHKQRAFLDRIDFVQRLSVLKTQISLLDDSTHRYAVQMRLKLWHPSCNSHNVWRYTGSYMSKIKCLVGMKRQTTFFLRPKLNICVVPVAYQQNLG